MYKGSDVIIHFLSKMHKATVEQITDTTGLNIDNVRRALEWLKEEGYVTIETVSNEKLAPTKEFEKYIKTDFPEFEVWKIAKMKNGAVLSELSYAQKEIGLRWAMSKDYVKIENQVIRAIASEHEINVGRESFKDAFSEINKSGKCDPSILNELLRRKLVSKSIEKIHTVIYAGKPISDLNKDFDLTIAAKNADIGKSHPISKMINRIKTIFVELGFSEMSGDIVESSFWNFDALFQPQDHPARELADTFYLEGNSELPDKKLIERVKKTHEHGWKYNWQEKEAKKQVLRTHTTALSARYLAANYGNKDPKKYFAIGKVFRNEATDYKHLAEFYQVEGILAWENATFSDLLGILKEFYAKLGFDKIRFRPSFFPYTEPSLEVEVFYEPRKQWLEIGGAGVFRPEVSIPLANVYPVLAWGLSLERPTMLMLGIEDIRTFYRNDVDFLRKVRM